MYKNIARSGDCRFGVLAVVSLSYSPTELKSASVADVDGKRFDVVVIGGTPAGVACAVRAAREGLPVLLVQHNHHIGGMMTNGLMQWDALYGGPRAPSLQRTAGSISKSTTARHTAPTRATTKSCATPKSTIRSVGRTHIAEREFGRLVARREE